MTTTNFRNQIKVLIKQKDISIAKLSRRADLSSGTVYGYLQGKSEISAANLAKLFDVLHNYQKEN